MTRPHSPTVRRADPRSARLRWALVGALATLAVLAATFWISTLIKSPSDVLASAAAPPPSVITVPIVRGNVAPSMVRGGVAVDDSGRIDVKVSPREARLAQENGSAVLLGEPGETPLVGLTVDPKTRLLTAEVAPRDRKTWVGVTGTLRLEGAGAEGLRVPMTALFADSRGDAQVYVAATDGPAEAIEVRVVKQGSGYALIEPVKGELAAGDEVQVSEPQ